MKISLNGKPITGSATEDEPPPAMHVIKRLMCNHLGSIRVAARSIVLGLKTPAGNYQEATIEVLIETLEDGTQEVELHLDLNTKA